MTWIQGSMNTSLFFITGLLIFSVYSCRDGNRNETGTFVADADYIQIVLFHLAQRCESCNAVEHETILLLENEYGEEVASGKVKFIPLNFQSENGKKAAELLVPLGRPFLLFMEIV